MLFNLKYSTKPIKLSQFLVILLELPTANVQYRKIKSIVFSQAGMIE